MVISLEVNKKQDTLWNLHRHRFRKLSANSPPSGFNQLVELLLNSLMQQERTLYLSSHEGDSRNGYRPRRFSNGQYEFSLKVPRSRQGYFYPILLAIPACLRACIASA